LIEEAEEKLKKINIQLDFLQSMNKDGQNQATIDIMKDMKVVQEENLASKKKDLKDEQEKYD